MSERICILLKQQRNSARIGAPFAVWQIPTLVGFELSKPGLHCASEAHN